MVVEYILYTSRELVVRVKGNFLILTGCLLLATEMTREGLRTTLTFLQCGKSEFS